MPEQAPPAPPAQETPPPDEPPKVEDTDWKAEARKWEQRAKDNKSAADKLAELEEAQKSELEKAADRAAAAEAAAQKASAEALRWKVAAKHGISDEDAEEFLTGIDEETLTRQAKRLAELVTDRKKNGNVVPKEGTTPREPQEDEMRAFTRRLFESGQTQ